MTTKMIRITKNRVKVIQVIARRMRRRKGHLNTMPKEILFVRRSESQAKAVISQSQHKHESGNIVTCTLILASVLSPFRSFFVCAVDRCKTRRVGDELIYCGAIHLKKGRPKKRKAERKCRKKYCLKCLLKFYGESPPPKPAPGEPNTWVCLGCRGLCTCAACKRTQLRRENKKKKLAAQQSMMKQSARMGAQQQHHAMYPIMAPTGPTGIMANYDPLAMQQPYRHHSHGGMPPPPSYLSHHGSSSQPPPMVDVMSMSSITSTGMNMPSYTSTVSSGPMSGPPPHHQSYSNGPPPGFNSNSHGMPPSSTNMQLHHPRHPNMYSTPNYPTYIQTQPPPPPGSYSSSPYQLTSYPNPTGPPPGAAPPSGYGPSTAVSPNMGTHSLIHSNMNISPNAGYKLSPPQPYGRTLDPSGMMPPGSSTGIGGGNSMHANPNPVGSSSHSMMPPIESAMRADLL